MAFLSGQIQVAELFHPPLSFLSVDARSRDKKL